MEAIQLNDYKIKKILSGLANEFGQIKKGDEDKYSQLLLPMESNMLKLHRRNEKLNSRRALEAVIMIIR